ncbi:MAG TPA: hypothetical protein EYM77_11315 [Dehalococcoidia bacterium]|nr:hypothetical protein [Dehalococcoidia bacterium]
MIEGDIASPPVQAGIERLKTLIATDDAFGEPRELEVSDSGRIALLAVPVEGDTSGEVSIAAVTRLDDIYVEEAFEGTGAKIYVSGETAFNMEFFNVSKNSAWIVFPFVLGISFLLLLVVFRSIVLPVEAIILNLMAVGAAYGILVLVFQEGFLAGFFGLQKSRTIESWIPLFLLTILFGLSMDYHVFLLSRIRENYDRTGDTTEAVAFGIRSTGRLITGAALIMVAVFWGCFTGSLIGLQQMGFGLGMAILLDATIVRCVMIPASMKFLGKWNWYLPSWLEWVPNVRFEPAEAAAPVASGRLVVTADPNLSNEGAWQCRAPSCFEAWRKLAAEVTISPTLGHGPANLRRPDGNDSRRLYRQTPRFGPTVPGGLRDLPGRGYPRHSLRPALPSVHDPRRRPA